LIRASGSAATMLAMPAFELLPEVRPDGTVIFRVVALRPGERLRRFARRFRRR
jgi:hypothetical protein